MAYRAAAPPAVPPAPPAPATNARRYLLLLLLLAGGVGGALWITRSALPPGIVLAGARDVPLVPPPLSVGAVLTEGLHVTRAHQQLAARLGVSVRRAIECVESSQAATAGWTLDEWAAAQSAAQAYRAQRAEHMATLSALSVDRADEWYDLSPPMFTCGPGGRRGAGLLRYGGADDGGKWLCALDSGRVPCTIYSLGSYGEFDFEEAMVAATACDIWSFDCTVAPDRVPASLHPRIHFEPTCIGTDSADGKFQSLPTIAKRLHHAHIHLLKMDIEGYEFGVLKSMAAAAAADFSGSYAFLPQQISFEGHLHALDPAPAKRAAVMLDSFQALLDMGYVPVSREYNLHCAHCEEYVFVRLAAQCWPAGHPPSSGGPSTSTAP